MTEQDFFDEASKLTEGCVERMKSNDDLKLSQRPIPPEWVFMTA